MDKNLNELLKWSIENSTKESTAITAADGDDKSTTNSTTEAAPAQPPRQLDPKVLASLFGGPSDAELMRGAMAVVCNTDPEVTLEDKLIAFDNFEQLIESLDNANNLGSLALWTPLLDQLTASEPEIRKMAAWCIGTAVQNNEPSQERLLAMGGIPRLIELVTKSDEDKVVRRKGVYALSSAVRNYQPAMDACSEQLEKSGRKGGQVDAQDMDSVTAVMDMLKEEINQA